MSGAAGDGDPFANIRLTGENLMIAMALNDGEEKSRMLQALIFTEPSNTFSRWKRLLLFAPRPRHEKATGRAPPAHAQGPIRYRLFCRFSSPRRVLQRLQGHLSVAANLSSMGSMYLEQGQYAYALDEFREALRIQQPLVGDHPCVADTLSSMGVVYQKQGQYELALDELREALRIQRAAYGNEHPGVAPTLSSMGVVYQKLGQYDLASDEYREALRIQRAAYGNEHPDVVDTCQPFTNRHSGRTFTNLGRVNNRYGRGRPRYGRERTRYGRGRSRYGRGRTRYGRHFGRTFTNLGRVKNTL
jgi:tetratricopeptide (TPR) repeat protein